jgi:hypothetical protein
MLIMVSIYFGIETIESVVGHTPSLCDFSLRLLALVDCYIIGSHVECRYALMSFGLCSDSFPVDDKGRLRKEEFIKYLEERERLEVEEEEAHVATGLLARFTIPQRTMSSWDEADPVKHILGNMRLATIIDIHRGL